MMSKSEDSARRLRWFRFKKSGLSKPFSDCVATAAALGGVQAQILPAAALSLFNRTQGLNYEGFSSLLFKRRSLVKLWGQRGTLHLYPTQDWPIICGVFQGRRSYWLRDIEKRGGDVNEFHSLVSKIEELLRDRKVLGRRELRDGAGGVSVDEDLLSSWGGIFQELVYGGYACHADAQGGEGRFAHRLHWAPQLKWKLPTRENANLNLARSYFGTYGPSSIQDFAYWRGSKVGEATRWTRELSSELRAIEWGGRECWLARKDFDEFHLPAPSPESWPIKMLYRFDPILLGHRDKQWIVDQKHYNKVWRPAGHIEAILLVDGQALATWRYDWAKSGIVITVRPFKSLPRYVRNFIEAHVPRIAEFFGVGLEDLAFERG